MSDEFIDDEVTVSDDAVTDVVQETNDELLDQRSDVERQRDEYLEALQRLQADFENYRKRVVRSADEAASRAAGDVVVKMLPVLDAFDLAQAHFAAASPRASPPILLPPPFPPTAWTQLAAFSGDALGRLCDTSAAPSGWRCCCAPGPG